MFNPYSGKFAGYDISKGKLNTDFHYKIDGRKLDAQHHIVIEQLEFGDKTAEQRRGLAAHQAGGILAQGPQWRH